MKRCTWSTWTAEARWGWAIRFERLGYMWGPTKPALELYRLEEPEYSDACWEADKRCAYPIAEVRILVADSLEDRAPEVVEFLRKWDFKAEAQVSTEI